jgi:hypothetical protein
VSPELLSPELPGNFLSPELPGTTLNGDGRVGIRELIFLLQQIAEKGAEGNK